MERVGTYKVKLFEFLIESSYFTYTVRLVNDVEGVGSPKTCYGRFLAKKVGSLRVSGRSLTAAAAAVLSCEFESYD